MALPLVKTGQAVTAAAWNELVEVLNRYLGEEFNAPGGKPGKVSKYYERCTIKNNSGAVLTAGSILRVTGMRFSNAAPDAAKRNFMSSGFQLAGGAPNGSEDEVVAILSETIAAGKIGRCVVPGLVGAFVQINSASDKYARGYSAGTFISCDLADGSGSGSGSNEIVSPPYRIVAKSATSAGSAFCFLQPVGGGDEGHLVGTVGSIVGGVYIVSAAGSNKEATSPLGHTYGVGETVIIDLNRQNNEWEILSGAEDEEGDGSGSGSGEGLGACAYGIIQGTATQNSNRTTEWLVAEGCLAAAVSALSPCTKPGEILEDCTWCTLGNTGAGWIILSTECPSEEEGSGSGS